MRPLQATIDLAALRHNLALVKVLAPRAKVMAVVKANAYGHGLLPVAHALNTAEGFAVLGLNEAAELRAAGFKQTLLLLEGVFTPEQLPQALQLGCSLVVHSKPQLDMLLQASLTSPMEVFLKLNSGMHRLGLPPALFNEALTALQAHPAISRVVAMTHFATADDAYGIEAQLHCFQQAVAGLDIPFSLANSAAILRFPETHADWVRPGIMLYGASPLAGKSGAELGLRPAMQLHSQIIAVQHLQPGEAFGYGRAFVAAAPTRVGIVACGYADGYPRHAPTGTPVAIGGKMGKTLGRVSMDMLAVDLSDFPHAEIGTEVELWGARVPVDHVAEASGTIGYELLCALAPRVPVRIIDGQS